MDMTASRRKEAAELAQSGAMRALPDDCPRCAGRDVVAIDRESFFCPWCLYEWTMASALVVDSTSDADGYLADLARAFEGESAQT
jgi:hypothetical protein